MCKQHNPSHLLALILLRHCDRRNLSGGIPERGGIRAASSSPPTPCHLYFLKECHPSRLRMPPFDTRQGPAEFYCTRGREVCNRDVKRLKAAKKRAGAAPGVATWLSVANKMTATTPPQRAVLALTRISMLLLAATAAEASAGGSAMPMAFAGGDLVTNLKEFGDAPVRTVSCVGAQGSGKSTLMRTMFGQGASNLALLEARSSAAYVPETNEFEVGAGQAMVSLAVSDATIYNVLVHDLHRPDAMSDVQVRRRPPYIKLGLVPQHGHYINQNTAAAPSGVVLQAASVQQRYGRITAVDTWGRKMMLLARPAHLWETLFKNALPPKHRPSAVVSLWSSSLAARHIH